MLETIDVDLPIRGCLDEIASRLSSGRLVISAPPGTGKTTLVPPLVADHLAGKVLVAQPRRVAARAAARRLSSLLGEKVGGQVGFSVRGESKVSQQTRIEFVTTGLLVRRLLADPDMTGVGAIILDEVHERSLDTDLAASLALDIHDMTGLGIIAMSATLAAPQWAGLMGGCDIVTSESHMFPVTQVFEPGPAAFGPRGVSDEFLEHVASLADHEDKTLVFLPGRREIAKVQQLVPGSVALHGSIPSDEQDAILSGRLGHTILATSIAESSLTVPGISRVVDSGLARRPYMDDRRGIGGLTTEIASKASMIQRGGRAGRLGPGVTHIALSEVTYSRAKEFTDPEILTGDITSFLLSALSWSSLDELRLLDRPTPVAVDAAMKLLESLGATSGGQITDLGRRISTFPTHPRIARALIDAAPLIGSSSAGEVAALLDEASGDLAAELAAMRRRPTRSWTQSAERLSRLVDEVADQGCDRETQVGTVLTRAYPDRIARRRGESYVLASGTGAKLPPGSPMTGSAWLAIGDLSAGQEAIIRSAVPITAEIAGSQAHTVRVHEIGRKVTASDVVKIGSIELRSTPAPIDPVAAREAILDHLVGKEIPEEWWSDDSRHLAERLSFLHQVIGDPWPAISPETIMTEDVLATEIDRWARGETITASMGEILQRILPWPEAAQLDELAPPRLPSPAGGTVAVHYETGEPSIRIKLQECFGWTDSPLICGVRLKIHMLSPAGRDLAVTSDLASFWAGPYAGVRSDMRGRYPKHPWPEDPLSATPTKKTKGRS